MIMGYNIIITILLSLVHKICFPQMKCMKMFAILGTPEMCLIVAIMCFSTRSYDHWLYADDARAKTATRLPFHPGSMAIW